MPANSVKGFRFMGSYCDVFIEDGHYLYAEAEPMGWAHMLACNEYHIIHGDDWIRYDTASTDAAYLLNLEKAPEEVARNIIATEYLRSFVYAERAEGNEPDEDERTEMWECFYTEA